METRPSRTVAIKTFLELSTEKDLASLYNYNMEVQVNVHQEDGTLQSGEYKGVAYRSYTNGTNTWKSFRIPRNANTVPEYEDVPMSYPLDKYADGIGMTGWDWVNKKSVWVAFDFDAIIGHSTNHSKKLTDDQLRKLKEKISVVEWITIRHSTSGNGLHVYVFFENPVTTQNHNEHAALGRAVLGLMSAESGCDLSTSVDACGQNMWVWHRKMKGTNGLQLIKAGTTLKTVPPHWEDHLDVIVSKRKKVLPFFIKEADDDNGTLAKLFDEITGLRPRVELDQQHLDVLNYLKNNQEFISWYDADNNMLVTHTLALKQAHETLNLKGIYDTISEGKDTTQNCFAYPCRNGAWLIRRYTPGVAETSTWEIDRNGWTRCFYNREPTLRTASEKYGGAEHPTGGYVFDHAETAVAAVAALGGNLSVPNIYGSNRAKIKEMKDNRISVELEIPDSDVDRSKLTGWIKEGKKWKRVVEIKSAPQNEVEIGNFDDVLRHVVSTEGEDQGWLIRGEAGQWKDEPLSHVKLFMSTFGLSAEEVTQTLGMGIVKAWTLINKPFQAEYPGDRTWNRNTVQLKFTPSQDLDNLNYPTWQKIFDHIGKGLDNAVKHHPWCQTNGIFTGSDYILHWVASMFQYPEEPLPYLFLYGEQDTGKSILHEALTLLVTRGVQRADRALTDPTFNGELENSILCVVEEIDLGAKTSKGAYNRIKDLVTSRTISIRTLYKQSYMITNTTHWIQTANEIEYCPVFPGDTRVTVVKVHEIERQNLIPKRDLISRLIKEGPDITAKLLSMEIPECKDRLRIPVLTTEDKAQLEQMNMNEVEKFILNRCHHAPGHAIKFSEFFEQFFESLDVNGQIEWSKPKVSKAINSSKYPKGKLPNESGDGYSSDIYLGNIAFERLPSKGYFSYDGDKLVLND